MQATNQLLTDRERKYAKRRFRNVKFVVRGLWPVFIIVALSGLPLLLIDDETFWPGFGLTAFGILGAIFFKRYSKKTTFEMSPTLHVHRGILNLRLVGLAGERHHRLYLDDYLMETSDGLEFYMNDLVEKYQDQKVQVMMAVFEQKKDGKTYEHYTPLKVEKDLCIDSAIKNHGSRFLKKMTYKLNLDISMFILIPFALTMFMILGIPALENINTGIFMTLLFIGWFFLYMLYLKLFPSNKMEIKEKLKCTCSTN